MLQTLKVLMFYIIIMLIIKHVFAIILYAYEIAMLDDIVHNIFDNVYFMGYSWSMMSA